MKKVIDVLLLGFIDEVSVEWCEVRRCGSKRESESVREWREERQEHGR